ncbi:MAG: 3-methyladenine glycosylase, partial [Frankiales bacterium]|nr:3-methyladenine glycosylase [Frankiales bacterium]
MLETVWRPRLPLDVGRTLEPLRRGGGDPAHRREPDGTIWRTTRTEAGPATYRLTQRSPHEVHCAAWGDGAETAIAGMTDLLGSGDDPTGFEPTHPLLRDTLLRNPGIRIPRSGRVLEAVVPAVLEQKVTGHEARSSWRWLLRKYGEAAPGPAPKGMRVPPSADVWRRVPSWDWHRAGVDPRRSRTVVTAARVASRL